MPKLNQETVPEHAILTEKEYRMSSVIRELHMTQLPFSLVARELLHSGLAFYPDETTDDLDRTIALLRKLVRDDKLAGIAPARGDAGTCDLEEARVIAAQMKTARQGVEGVGILATHAEAKYGLSNPSIYSWHKGGWIGIVAIENGNRLFNEGDIAFARALATLINYKPGKPIFPTSKPSGRPPKS
jgi:hypothetical protein